MTSSTLAKEKAIAFKSNYSRTLSEAERWQSQKSEPTIEPALPIIDAHHHLTDDGHGRYLLEEFVKDTQTGHNIVATVHVQAHSMVRAHGPDHMKFVGETEFVRGMAAMSDSGKYGPTRVGAAIVGHADLRRGAAAEDVLTAHIEAGGGHFRGVRQSAGFVTGELARAITRVAPEGLLLDQTFREGFAKLAPLGLTFDAWVFHPQLGDVYDLARRFPQTTIILNHMGGLCGVGQFARNPDEEFENWRRSIEKLAICENVVMKVGGLGLLYCGFGFDWKELPPSSEELAAVWAPRIRVVVDAFGPQRAMFESNFPVDKQSCSYHAMWNAFKRVAANWSPHEKRALFHDTAARVYRI